jgi:hypothetical protein
MGLGWRARDFLIVSARAEVMKADRLCAAALCRVRKIDSVLAEQPGGSIVFKRSLHGR